MKTSLHSSPRGQALVLIALAAVGLFAFAALAIDGSSVFSDRRHAQNAADTAAYAAALARVRDADPSLQLWKQPGIDRAASNGYTNDGVTEVRVYTCLEWKTSSDNPNPGQGCKALPAGANPDEFVYVRIKSRVKLFFARVIGWSQVFNNTDAIAHASPPKVDEWFSGKALVSAKKGCPVPGDNSVPFVIGGNGTTVVNNSGIWVNSTCDPAMKDAGNSNVVTTTDGICVVGGVPQPGEPGAIDGVTPPPTEHCGTQVDITQYWMPDPEQFGYCSNPGSIIDHGGGNYEATPGYFNKTGNKTFPDASPAGVLKLQKGVYCLYNGFVLNGNWTITTDLNGNGSHDGDSEGVFFYVPDGDVTFNGGSNLNLHAMDDAAGGFPAQLMHYLLFIPLSNAADVTITGNNGSTFTGTVLAPASHITLDGSGNAFDLHTQIIGYDTTITGAGHINITYNPDDQAPSVILPTISTTE